MKKSPALIVLTRNQFAVVDAEDLDRVLEIGPWHARRARENESFYALRGRGKGETTKLTMHNFISGYEKTDHVNGDGLDNRRVNLRAATASENCWNSKRRLDNSTGYIGVDWHKSNSKWRARVKAHGRSIFLGYYGDPIEAALAVDAAKLKYHGEFARLNFPIKETA